MTTDDDPAAPGDRDIGRGLLEAEMGPSSALAHLYRGEVHRMKMWRERLDRTTNWAVMMLAALLTWGFSSTDNPHYVLLVGVVMLGVFLFMEAHRYRGFDMWRSRVRALQENVFAQGLDPTTEVADPRWRERLSHDYRNPRLKIPLEEAIAHRLRRVYLALLAVVVAAWVFRVTAFADAAWPASAAVATIPGLAVTGLVALVVAVTLVVAWRPREWHTRGELLETDVDARRELKWSDSDD